MGDVFGGKPTPPAAPDYVGAAKEQSASSAANTAQAASLNRPDIYTPLGSQTWTQNSPDKYTQNINLSDAGQKLFDSQNQTSQAMADTAGQAFGRAQDSLSKPVDLSTVGGGSQQQIQDALYNRQSQYLDPQFAQAESAERDRLANSGFQVGNKGFDDAMGNFNRSKQAAYANARDQAITGGQAARQQAIQEALLQRQTPLNELSALRTGSQVQMPSFQSTQGVNPSDPTQSLAAAGQLGQFNLGTYNTQAAQQNALISGIMGVGAGAATGYALRP